MTFIIAGIIAFVVVALIVLCWLIHKAYQGLTTLLMAINWLDVINQR